MNSVRALTVIPFLSTPYSNVVSERKHKGREGRYLTDLP